jgi:hypothetical protein
MSRRWRQAHWGCLRYWYKWCSPDWDLRFVRTWWWLRVRKNRLQRREVKCAQWLGYLSQRLGFSRKFASNLPIGYSYLSQCDSIWRDIWQLWLSHLPISPWWMWFGFQRFRSLHNLTSPPPTNPIKPFNYLTEGGSCSSPTDSFVSQGTEVTHEECPPLCFTIFQVHHGFIRDMSRDRCRVTCHTGVQLLCSKVGTKFNLLWGFLRVKTSRLQDLGLSVNSEDLTDCLLTIAHFMSPSFTPSSSKDPTRKRVKLGSDCCIFKFLYTAPDHR